MARTRIDPDLLQDATLRALKNHGLTQQGLAERAGVSLGSVGNWARGNGGRADSVAKLAAAFPDEVNLHDLLVDDDQPGAVAARLEVIEAQMSEALSLLRKLATTTTDAGGESDETDRFADAAWRATQAVRAAVPGQQPQKTQARPASRATRGR